MPRASPSSRVTPRACRLWLPSRRLSATAPGIVDADLNPVLTRSEVYSGVYGRASITLYAFNSNGNRGIACGLNNLQLIRAGEPLGGKASAESNFATDDDDDFLN